MIRSLVLASLVAFAGAACGGGLNSYVEGTSVKGYERLQPWALRRAEG